MPPGSACRFWNCERSLAWKPMHHVKWDCFVWPANLDCGKAPPLLASVTRLRKDTRRTLRIQHEVRRADERVGCATEITQRTTQLAGAPVRILRTLERTNLARLRRPCIFFNDLTLLSTLSTGCLCIPCGHQKFSWPKC